MRSAAPHASAQKRPTPEGQESAHQASPTRKKGIRIAQAATRLPACPRVVERTLAWMGRFRRMSKDHEFHPETSEAMIHVAMINIMVRRLAAAYYATFQVPSQTASSRKGRSACPMAEADFQRSRGCFSSALRRMESKPSGTSGRWARIGTGGCSRIML
jgi:hypothetical protein